MRRNQRWKLSEYDAYENGEWLGVQEEAHGVGEREKKKREERTYMKTMFPFE